MSLGSEVSIHLSVELRPVPMGSAKGGHGVEPTQATADSGLAEESVGLNRIQAFGIVAHASRVTCERFGIA